MAQVWTMDNKVNFDPADIKQWEIREPGEWDLSLENILTRWQVLATPRRGALINVGLYNSEEEAVKAVDALDAMGKDQVMPKVWNWNNMHKFDPADVRRWTIHEPGEKDCYREGGPMLTRWQVGAIFEKIASVNVGYYDTHEEAVKVVDALDAMKKGDMLDEEITQ